MLNIPLFIYFRQKWVDRIFIYQNFKIEDELKIFEVNIKISCHKHTWSKT